MDEEQGGKYEEVEDNKSGFLLFKGIKIWCQEYRIGMRPLIHGGRSLTRP